MSFRKSGSVREFNLKKPKLNKILSQLSFFIFMVYFPNTEVQAPLKLLKSKGDTAEEGWKYSRVYYSGAVMVLMEEVEQKVRSPQHLCGRLMAAQEQEGETDRKREKLWHRPRPVPLTQRSHLPDLCREAMMSSVCALLLGQYVNIIFDGYQYLSFCKLSPRQRNQIEIQHRLPPL